jgi:hypothetical protein
VAEPPLRDLKFPRNVATSDQFLGFDNKTGALNYLSFDSGASSWAGPNNLLFWLEYQTYSQADFTSFMESYNYLSYLYEADDYYDFDKVGIDAGGKPGPDIFYFKLSALVFGETGSLFLLKNPCRRQAQGRSSYSICLLAQNFGADGFYDARKRQLPSGTVASCWCSKERL